MRALKNTDPDFYPTRDYQLDSISVNDRRNVFTTTLKTDPNLYALIDTSTN